MTRRPRLLAVTASVVALTPGSAAGADDPSAYTDPAPRPIQDEQAAKDVQDELRREGVVARVTPEQVRSGVVVIATPAPSGGSSSTPSKGGGQKPPATRSSTALALTAKGLAPSVRSGVPRPQDPAVPEPILLAIAAAALAGWAALLALGRRRRITSL